VAYFTKAFCGGRYAKEFVAVFVVSCILGSCGLEWVIILKFSWNEEGAKNEGGGGELEAVLIKAFRFTCLWGFTGVLTPGVLYDIGITCKCSLSSSCCSLCFGVAFPKLGGLGWGLKVWLGFAAFLVPVLALAVDL